MTAALVGCADTSVRLTPPSPDAEQVRACTALARELPATVADQARRPTDPASALTAAWGDPAITVTCGAPQPDRPLDAQLLSVDGITWYPEPLTNGTRFTTEGRVAAVRLDVPRQYRPEVAAPTDLADAIGRTIPTQRREVADDGR